MEEKRSMEGGCSVEEGCSMEKAHSAGASYSGGDMLIQLQRQDALSQYERMRGQIRIPLFPEKRHVLALLLSAAAVTAMAFIPSPVRRQAELIHQVREQAGEELEELENLLDALEEVDMETITKKLYDGDFVIMVSDGIVDALDCPDKEEAMGRIIMDIHTANPKQMAISVLSQALAKCKGVPEDDMTVICTGIWEKV